MHSIYFTCNHKLLQNVQIRVKVIIVIIIKIIFLNLISGIHQTVSSNDQRHDASGGKFQKEETCWGQREEREGKGEEEGRDQTAEGHETQRDHG